MKRIFILTLIASSLAAVYSSCTRDPEMDDNTAGQSFGYNRAEDAIAAAEAIYCTGAPAFYGECSISGIPAAMTGGYLSGYFSCESDVNTGLYVSCRNLLFDNGSMSDYTQSVWQQAYQAIAICDELILNVPLTSGLTDEQKSRFIAEARFFRAFNYFYLVRMFGEVPVTASDDDVVIESGLAGVYDSIVRDLKLASEDLPYEAFTRNEFHISRPTVLTLLADVYLTMSGWPLRQEYYTQAAETARQIIKSDCHSLLANGETFDASAWNKLRIQNDNAECIYSYRVGDVGRSLFAFTLPKDAENWGVVKTGTSDAFVPTEAFMSLYDNYGDTRSHEQQFFHSFVKYEKETRTIIQTFQREPYWWFDSEALFETGTTDMNVTIYRYAEVLLIAAESIAKTEGVTSEAVDYLTDVRTRALSGIERETIQGELMALSSDEFIEEIWAERLREFPLEMKLWPDIQRTRKYPVPSTDGTGDITFIDIVGASSPSNSSFELKHLLLPVPQQ
jgi:hypothetical protein